MRHGLRAGGIVAPLLALASSAASATPSSARAQVPSTVSLIAHVARLTRTGIVGTPAGGRSETSNAPTFDTRPEEKIASQVSMPSAEAVMPGLHKLVRAYEGEDSPDAERKCLAGAVYFEARGEPLEGQLAVAEVILNRAASGEYPASICDVVTQPAQFSFVRDGFVPPIDGTSVAWRTALAVAQIADEKLANELAPNVLWYHADYVAPSWDRHLTPVARIGAHIFYRRA